MEEYSSDDGIYGGRICFVWWALILPLLLAIMSLLQKLIKECTGNSTRDQRIIQVDSLFGMFSMNDEEEGSVHRSISKHWLTLNVPLPFTSALNLLCK